MRGENRFVGLKFDLGACVLTDFDEDDFLRAQPDALGTEPQVEPYELHHPFGFSSRPLDPDVGPDGKPLQGQACNLLFATRGNATFAWLAADPRAVPGLPRLKQGESVMYSTYGAFMRCHVDGTISIFTTDDGSTDGRSVYFQVRPDGFRWVAPWGKMVFDATGFHMLTKGGARIDAGSIGGLPPPLDQLSTYVSVVAGIIKMQASVSAEGAPGVPEPIAKATSTLSVLTAIQAALTAIGSALTALGNGSAGAAITASATALATGTASIPSTSKQVT